MLGCTVCVILSRLELFISTCNLSLATVAAVSHFQLDPEGMLFVPQNIQMYGHGAKTRKAVTRATWANKHEPSAPQQDGE